MKEQIRHEDWENNFLQNRATYYDNHIALFDQMVHLESYSTPKMSAYGILLCLQGEGSLYINGELHKVRAYDVLMCYPNIVLENSAVSGDFRFQGILMSSEYLRKLAIITGSNVWDIKVLLDKSPILTLEEHEAQIFQHYYNLLKFRLNSPKPISFKREIIGSILLSFLYEMYNILERFTQLHPNTYTSNENIFRKFLDLLIHTNPKPRQVCDYADKLCVTPKYLSTVCKATSGFTASELIHQYVVKDVQLLLKKQDKSIKDIAYELDFPNLSFFGKYVKKHLGMSPRQYRESQQQASIP